MVEIKDNKQFKAVLEQNDDMRIYIAFLESKLDAAIYQEERSNKLFAKAEDDKK